MSDMRRNKVDLKTSKDMNSTIYTDWANYHLEKTGEKRPIQDLPKDISDGVLLAEIVEFVCGKAVERIHEKPRTTKQKLHNIERCLKVLEESKVVLNDVTIQGLYRCELKCVLALFFHLSRYKQKERDFKMSDATKSNQKRCLRPPSAVGIGRKSQSFNSNDRNRINLDISTSGTQCRTTPASPADEPSKLKGSQSRVPSTGAQVTINGWRSKSMNVKHTATTRLLAPKSTAPTFQTFKPETASAVPSSGSKCQSGSEGKSVTAHGDKKPASSTRISSPSRKPSANLRKPLVTATSSLDSKMKSDVTNPRSSSRDRTAKTSLTKQNVKKSVQTSKAAAPNRSTDRSGSRGIPNPRSISIPAPEAETKTSKSGSKPTSMISRLRKLGSPTSAHSSNAPKSRPTSVTKATSDSVSPSSTLKKRAESCPPTSRLSARPPLSQQKPASGVKDRDKTPVGKSQPGIKSVKSSLGKALRTKQSDKKAPASPAKSNGSLFKNKKSSGITKSEICPIIPMVTNADQPVVPISLHEAQANDSSAGFSRTPSDVTMTSSLPLADRIAAETLGSGQTHVKPVSISIATTKENKVFKTAMVAPFIRHASAIETPEIEKPLKQAVIDPPLTKPEESAVDSSTNTEEARVMAVKGIADLRQNLEETMSSLRNTQLRHREGDAFQRRVSAQLGEDFTCGSESSPMSRSSAIYRSHHNLSHHRTGVHVHLAYGSNTPKLYAGETLGHHPACKFGPGQYSSLQRTRSARMSRASWGESSYIANIRADNTESIGFQRKRYDSDASILNDLESDRNWTNKKGSKDGDSGSSEDLSDCIGGLNPDNLSSNNSPVHQMKTHEVSSIASQEKWKELGNGLSKSTMDIGNRHRSIKQLKKKGLAKQSGLRTPGSSAVGSRLAYNAENSSPCASPSQQAVSNIRTIHSYRSLPRPSKTRLNDDKPASSYDTATHSSSKSFAAFKRSPSLQKLFGLGKSKQNLAELPNQENGPVVYSNSHTTSSPSIKPTSTTINTSAMDTYMGNCNEGRTSPQHKQFNNYNSLGRPKKSREGSSLSYLSLPRRPRTTISTPSSLATGQSSLASTVMTWSPPKRPNANSAYSITPPTTNPYMSLMSTPSLNIDDKESVNYADPDNILQQTDSDVFKGEVSDWPLPTLLSSSGIAASNPNMASTDLKLSDRVSPTKSSYSKIFSNADKTHSLMMNSTQSLNSNKQRIDSNSTEDSVQSQILTQVKSVSAFKNDLNGIGDSVRNLSKEVQNNETELQQIKTNIQDRMKQRSPDGHSNPSSSVLRKKASSGSVTSINSMYSAPSMESTDDGTKKKKKHWLRESLKTAFSKRKSRSNLTSGLEEESAQSLREEEESEVVAQLKEELLKKERKLTDIRLEALSSQHQLHQMQDAMQKMKSEIETLRLENERLNKMGQSTINVDDNAEITGSCSFALFEPVKTGDQRMLVKVEFPDHMIADDADECTRQTVLGVCHVARSISWRELDEKVQLVFQNFCQNIAPASSLGLDASSILSYAVGDATRIIDGEVPDLLPCGYIVGNVDSLLVKLRDGNDQFCDALALELLIDRDTVERYVHLVLEHGRVMLSGPSGTGKSTLANRLAEHVVRMNPKRTGHGNLVRLDLKHRTENEIAEYLHQLCEDCSKPESSGRNIPVVLVLDDLHRSFKLKEAIVPLLNSAAHFQLPYLIGVAEQNCESGLELHQEFKWILCSNHTPPVHDYLSRFLRRSLCRLESSNNEVDETVARVVNWLPDCWKYINKCIETHSSANVTLGPRLFSSCPMNGHQSLVWFTDLWNFSVVPYVISAVKQASKARTSNIQWSDPLEWIEKSWPWSDPCDLLPIRAEDVVDHYSAESVPLSPSLPNNDPLLNMMLKLQEAANNYESDTSYDESFERSLDKALGDLS